MEYLVVTLRMVTVTALFLVVALMLGKRYIGELSVFDFIIAITLGSVAGADLADPKIPHGPTFLTIVGLGLIHLLLSRTILKNRKVGRWLTFDPTIVIQSGIILKDNLAKIRYTVDELLSHLRQKDVFDLSEVEFAILEPNGTLSVLKKSQHLPATPKLLGITTQYIGLSIPLILEGKVNQKNLQAVNLSEKWLQDKLTEMGYSKPEQIFLAMLNTKGELYISPESPPLSIQRLDY